MTRPVRDPRIRDLLADRALVGLDDADARALRESGAENESDESYDLAAAAADLATLAIEPMPAQLEARIARTVRGVRATPRPTPWPWLLAAACALLAASGWMAYATKSVPPQLIEVRVPALPAPVPAAPTPAQEREELLRSAADARTFAWSGTKDPASAHVAGDVVWSEAAQRGYMRFRGLAQNDATKSQYQLWVFDAAQDHPVDGGVFDIGSESEIVVPIRAKLRVAEPTLFAVTIEKPGGVVVSKKEHIVAVAPVKG